MESWSNQKWFPGLCLVPDDISRVLSLEDSLNLTTFDVNKGLLGVITWNADIDSTCPDGNTPYAYSLGIQSILNK